MGVKAPTEPTWPKPEPPPPPPRKGQSMEIKPPMRLSQEQKEEFRRQWFERYRGPHSGKSSHTWMWVVIAILAILVIATSCKMASPMLEGGQTATVSPVIEEAASAPMQSPNQHGTVNINWQDAAYGAGGAGVLALFAFVVWRTTRVTMAAINRLRNGKNGNMIKGPSGRFMRRGPPDKG